MTDTTGGDRDDSGVGDDDAKGGRWRKGLLIGAPVAVVVLGGAYVGLAAWQSGKIQRGTVVAGRDIGGMSPSDARAEVRAAAAHQGRTPVHLVLDGKTLTLNPAKSGLTMDPSGVLQGLSGFSLNPSTVWHRLTGDGPHRALAPKVDKAELRKAVASASEGLKGAPKSGTVKFIDGKVVTTRSTPGSGVDVAAISSKIAAGWPDTTKFTARLSHRPAAVTNKEIRRYVKDFAQPAMSGPVTVEVAGKKATLGASDISDVLRTTFDGTKLSPEVDQAALAKLIEQQAGKLTTPAVDAKLSYEDGKRTITPAKNGTGPDTTGAGKLLIAALTASDRTMSLPTKTVKPAVTAADLKKTKVGQEKISEFVSEFPTGPQNAARTHNIKVGLAKINGLVVQPGQTFSLLSALRPFNAANGYVNAPVLVGGRDVPGMGGGISQVSTTLYNATFFAGVKLVDHTAHSYWIPRYPMGREATMWDPTIDNKWTNDTGHPIRIEAGIEGHAAVIRLYGVKTFTVSTTTSDKFDFVSPGPAKHLSGPRCIPQPPMDGFSVTVTRTVKNLSGKVVKDESVTTHYQPAVRVTCD